MRYDFSALDDSTSVESWIRSADVHSTTHPLNSSPPTLSAIAPGASFASPGEVLASGDLSREEKRVVLASWASDAWTVESAPALRQSPFGGPPVGVDEVLAALRALDGDLSENAGSEVFRPSRVRPLGAMRRRALH
jgi:hypothetical protein